MSDAPATKARAVMAAITFSPSGETIEVPAGTSLLDAAILCDLDQPSCRAVLQAFQDASVVEWLGQSVRVCAGAPRVPALLQDR